jgi:hypothetical protein
MAISPGAGHKTAAQGMRKKGGISSAIVGRVSRSYGMFYKSVGPGNKSLSFLVGSCDFRCEFFEIVALTAASKSGPRCLSIRMWLGFSRKRIGKTSKWFSRSLRFASRSNMLLEG